MTDLWLLPILGLAAAVGILAAVRTRVTVGSRTEGALAVAAVWFLAALILVPAFLARIGHLHRAGMVVAGVLVAAVVGVLAVRYRHRLPRPHLGRVALVGVVVVILAAPQLLAIVARGDSVPVGTPWYFWYLAQDYAEGGEVPATSPEFGTETTALADYTGFSAATAVLSLVAGGPDGIHAAQVMRAVAVLGTALGFLLLARAWGASIATAVGGAAVLMALAYFAGKLSSYRPEGFGYPLLLLLPALLLAFLRGRERAVLVTLGVGVAALSQVHGISFTVAGVLLGATFATRLPAVLRDRWGELRGLVAPAGVIVAGWWAADLVLSGRLTQTGKATSVPRVSEVGVDPTLSFMRAVRADRLDTFPITGPELVDSILRSGTYLHRAVWDVDLWPVVVAVAVLAAVAAVVTRTAGIGALLGFAGAALAGVLVICVAFQVGWETYVPRRTGWSRFLGQALLLVPLVASAAIGLGRGRRWARALTAVWVVVGLGAYGLTAGPIFRVHESQPSVATMAALRDLDLPDDAVLTTNAYSEGFVAAVLHREAVTNGRGPYHQAELLDTAVAQLDAARDFFGAPATEVAYLRERGVTHVLIGTEPYVFGTTQLYETDRPALDELAELELVTEGPGFVLYAVAAPVA